MGVILGIAVLLDAMLIRLVLIRTLLGVFGHSSLLMSPGRPRRALRSGGYARVASVLPAIPPTSSTTT
jgi:hypothetical protein